MSGCELSRHQCGLAWIKSDCTRLAGEGEAVVDGGWWWWWWCVVSRSSSHRVGARRGQQKCGLAVWLSGCLG